MCVLCSVLELAFWLYVTARTSENNAGCYRVPNIITEAVVICLLVCFSEPFSPRYVALRVKGFAD